MTYCEPLGDVPVGARVRLTTVPLRGGQSLLDARATFVRVDALGDGDWTPVFRLDSGREVRGYECWWTLCDGDVPA